MYVMKKRVEKFVTKLQGNIWYALLFLLLALTSVGLLLYEHFGDLDAATIEMIGELDIYVASLFLFDFFLGVVFNKRYSHTDHRHHLWLDLLASIPVGLEFARAFRIFRVFRALKIISSSLEFYYAEERLRRLMK